MICTRETLSALLFLLPCLRHLRVDMSSDDTSAWDRAIFRKRLLSLRIGFHRLMLDDLTMLLGPQLRRLHVEVLSEQGRSICFAYLAMAITTGATHLQHFTYDYRGMPLPIESIRASHWLFESVRAVKPLTEHSNSFVCRMSR